MKRCVANTLLDEFQRLMIILDQFLNFNIVTDEWCSQSLYYNLLAMSEGRQKIGCKWDWNLQTANDLVMNCGLY